MSRHADNIGRNIIALQHPKESLREFVSRCDTLRQYHDTPEPPPAPVQAPSEFDCDTCQDAGRVAVLEGARWAEYDCPDCTKEPA